MGWAQWTKCDQHAPRYLVEIEIKSCETVHMKMNSVNVNSETWTSTLVKGRIVESVQIPLSERFHERYLIENTDMSILMASSETKNCASFGADILRKEKISLVLGNMCCDAGQAYCEYSNNWGFDLPSNLKRRGGYKIDLNYDFIGKPSKDTYVKEREMLYELYKKESQEAEPRNKPLKQDK